MIAVGLEHLIGLLRAPRTCAVESDGALLPTLADGIDNAPSFDDFVGSCEEGGITKNGVAEKAFVGFGGVGTELAGVAEFHIDGLHGATSRLLGVEGKVDSFVGLQADVHGVTAEEIAEFCSKEGGGRTTEDNNDLGGTGGQSLAGAKIEGDAGPAPVIDLYFESGVGFRSGLRIDAVALAVAFVLGADGAGTYDFHLGGGNGAEHFYFLIVNGLGGKVGGGLHGGDGEKLHHVVLHHVAHGADTVIEGPAGTDALLFGDGDLDVVDKVTIPDGFPDGVRKAEVEEILDCLFAEVVIDTEEVGFVEAGVKVGDELVGGGEVVAEGFLHNDTGG